MSAFEGAARVVGLADDVAVREASQHGMNHLTVHHAKKGRQDKPRPYAKSYPSGTKHCSICQWHQIGGQ